VTVVQRFGSALNLNLHFHCLVLDGVYVEDARTGALSWHRCGSPSTSDVQELAERIAWGCEGDRNFHRPAGSIAGAGGGASETRGDLMVLERDTHMLQASSMNSNASPGADRTGSLAIGGRPATRFRSLIVSMRAASMAAVRKQV
jgi:hypothetical protein